MGRMDSDFTLSVSLAWEEIVASDQPSATSDQEPDFAVLRRFEPCFRGENGCLLGFLVAGI